MKKQKLTLKKLALMGGYVSLVLIFVLAFVVLATFFSPPNHMHKECYQWKVKGEGGNSPLNLYTTGELTFNCQLVNINGGHCSMSINNAMAVITINDQKYNYECVKWIEVMKN